MTIAYFFSTNTITYADLSFGTVFADSNDHSSDRTAQQMQDNL